MVNNISNIQENISYIDNNNLYINKTIADIVPKKQNCVLNKTYLGPENNKRSKSPNILINNKGDTESENSQIIFNNVRPTVGNNYSHSNNNSSLLNNLTNLSSLSSRKTNNTNILNNDKFIKNYLEQTDSSYLKTEVNNYKENNSFKNGIIQKKKIVQNKKVNPFKKEGVDNKKNKIESNCINQVKKINSLGNY